MYYSGTVLHSRAQKLEYAKAILQDMSSSLCQLCNFMRTIVLSFQFIMLEHHLKNALPSSVTLRIWLQEYASYTPAISL